MAVVAPRVLRLAHRGDHRSAPENTIAAFLDALRVPACDGVELDVRAAADGTPVVLHDATLERVFGRSEQVAELPTAELAAIGVPTLAAVLETLPPTAFVDVELKEDVVDRAIADVVAARGDPPTAIALSSFDDRVLATVRRRAPRWPRWLNAIVLDAETVELARDRGCAAVAVEWHAIDGAALARARAAGLQVAAWTVRRRPTAARLERLGVMALCVEGPALDPRRARRARGAAA